MARGVLEIPTVNAAASVVSNPDGTCERARLVVGAVSFKPIVVEPTQLVGERLEHDRVRAAIEAAVRAGATPMADVRGSAAYKREMAVEFSARALMTAWRRAND
jgi:CO/xanthine dehydrogenase FAD-binding subunit